MSKRLKYVVGVIAVLSSVVLLGGCASKESSEAVEEQTVRLGVVGFNRNVTRLKIIKRNQCLVETANKRARS